MPIEFRCTQCNKLLRTGDDTAGRQAQCPACGVIMPVPGKSQPSGETPPNEGNPFGNPPVAGEPQFSPSPDSGNPYQSPGEYSPFRSGFTPGEIRPSTLDLGEAFARAWEIFKVQWGMCVAATLIVQALGFVVGMALGLLPIVGPIVNTLFSVWLGIGQAIFFLNVARGQQPQIEDLFTGWPRFWKILGASLLVGLIVVGITLVCVVPLTMIGFMVGRDAAPFFAVLGGVIAVIPVMVVSLSLSQFYYLIIDRDFDIIESLKMSRSLMEGNKATLLLIYLTFIPITIVAVLPCFLGLLVAVPFFCLMYAVIYLLVTGQPTAANRQFSIPPAGG